AFIGAPNYIDDAQDYSSAFRHTGDLSYGGKLFLSGVEKVKFNLNYYRETGLDGNEHFSVYKETAGFGITYFDGVKGDYRSFDAAIDQDVQRGLLARGSARFTIAMSGFKGELFGDYYDVRDDFPFGRELIIRFISAGRESRGGASAACNISQNFDVYAGFTYTDVELRSGRRAAGQIYRAGANAVLVKEAGLSANFEIYDYESEFMDSYGVAGEFQWQFAEDFLLTGSLEKAYLRDSRHDNSAVSAEGKLLVYLTESFTLSVYAQIGSDNRFVDKNRWGGELKYAF
ncbi:MAG: hypothetical protein LBP51_01855, partial [Deferribacteraceae bacterium]|nr:hypothetical protein [Deferribacteraceae bacterium]